MSRIRLMDRNRLVLWTDSLPVAAATLEGLHRATPSHPYAIAQENAPPLCPSDIEWLRRAGRNDVSSRWYDLGFFSCNRLQQWGLVELTSSDENQVTWKATRSGREAAQRLVAPTT